MHGEALEMENQGTIRAEDFDIALDSFFSFLNNLHTRGEPLYMREKQMANSTEAYSHPQNTRLAL